jgi:hypothetical protein
MPQRRSASDLVTYWLSIAGVYFLVGVLFFYSGKGKLFDQDGHAPPGIKKQFQGTFVDKVPGIDAIWVILGIIEFAVFVLIVISLIRGEFLPHKLKPILIVALSLALFDFACLSFGETSTGQTSGKASLYTYFGVTAIIIMLVRRLQPLES